jgi:hypothetical protein
VLLDYVVAVSDSAKQACNYFLRGRKKIVHPFKDVAEVVNEDADEIILEKLEMKSNFG